MIARLNRRQRVKIAAAAGCDERSVVSAYASRPTRAATHARVLEAALALSLPLPPARLRPKKALSRQGAERLAQRVRAAQRRLAPCLPEIDPGDLGLILERLLRPPGSGRRFFYYPRQGGGFVY